MQPHSVCGFRYRLRMEKRADPRRVLWQNVRALMQKRYGKENLTQFAKDTGVGPGTASRLKAQETYAQLDTIEQIAAEFDLLPWQLLVPGMEPENPPVLRDASPEERKLYRRFMAVKKVLEGQDDDPAS